VVNEIFQMFDMSISSGDIRDQNRKLSEIAPKFESFLALPNFWGRAFQKLYARYHPYLGSRRLEKFLEDTPTSPEVIEAHALNFKRNFKFPQLKFFGGPPSQLVCALDSWTDREYLRSISSAFKNFRAQHPLMAEM